MFLFLPNLEELLFSVLDAIDRINTILVHLIQTNRSFLYEGKKKQTKGNSRLQYVYQESLLQAVSLRVTMNSFKLIFGGLRKHSFAGWQRSNMKSATNGQHEVTILCDIFSWLLYLGGHHGSTHHELWHMV